jgi:hypothetical protein
MANMYMYGSYMNIMFLDKIYDFKFNAFIYPFSCIALGCGYMIIGKLYQYHYINNDNIQCLIFTNIAISTMLFPIIMHKYLL